MENKKIKIISYIGIISLLASMIVSLLGYSNTTNNMTNIKNELLRKQVENNINVTMKYIENSYGTLTQGNETLFDSEGKSIEGRFDVVDSLLEDLGDKSTIFVKVRDDFKRISTNVMSSENERAMDTYLGSDHNAYETVMSGELYVGKAEILDEDYYTAYQPIKDENENVIGLLFVGVPTKILDDIVELHDTKMDRINILIIILRVISLGSLIKLVNLSAIGKRLDESD